MEVTAYKATDGRIYVELRDSEDKSIWCASHPAGEGYYAAQEFQFVAIGANDPVRDGWDERETVPAWSIELAWPRTSWAQSWMKSRKKSNNLSAAKSRCGRIPRSFRPPSASLMRKRTRLQSSRSRREG